MANYGPDFITGGTPSAQSEIVGYEASKGKDGNGATYWASNNTKPNWWKYDLGASVTKTAAKLTINAYVDANGAAVKNFTLAGSNDDSSYTDIHTGLVTSAGGSQSFEFSNATAYRYYRLTCTDNYRADGYVGFWEIYAYELASSFVPKIIIC